jgi:hypothetical protein
LAFEIVSTNEDTGASFPFTLKNGKKGAIFEVQLIEGGKFLETKISGVFAVDLRPGVAGMLKDAGANLDFRIRGVMWKGGAYKGFMASVAGGDYEQNSTGCVGANFPSTLTGTTKGVSQPTVTLGVASRDLSIRKVYKRTTGSHPKNFCYADSQLALCQAPV